MRILCLLLLLMMTFIYSTDPAYAQQGYPQGQPRYPNGGKMDSGGGQSFGSGQSFGGVPGDEVSKSMVESYHEILPDKLTPAAARYFPSHAEIVAVISGVLLLLLFITLEKHAVFWLGLGQEVQAVPENGGEPKVAQSENSVKAAPLQDSGELKVAQSENSGELKEDAAPEEKYPQAGEGVAKSTS